MRTVEMGCLICGCSHPFQIRGSITGRLTKENECGLDEPQYMIRFPNGNWYQTSREYMWPWVAVKIIAKHVAMKNKVTVSIHRAL